MAYLKTVFSVHEWWCHTCRSLKCLTRGCMCCRSCWPHSRCHISTHNWVRALWFANTFGGSSVSWLELRYLPRHTQGESAARSQTVLYQQTKLASISTIWLTLTKYFTWAQVCNIILETISLHYVNCIMVSHMQTLAVLHSAAACAYSRARSCWPQIIKDGTLCL